jgi:hypothetical protein
LAAGSDARVTDDAAIVSSPTVTPSPVARQDAAGALRNFATAPMVEQIKMLSLAAQNVPGGMDFFKRLIGGWKAGRVDLVLSCAKERVAQMPIMFGSLIEGRSRLWLPRPLDGCSRSWCVS